MDSTEDTTDTGEIVVDFKGDVPADLMGAIEFINASSLNGQLETPAGDPITFTVNGSGQLVGSDGTNDVVIITIPPLIMFMFFQLQIVSGMTAGAIKG